MLRYALRLPELGKLEANDFMIAPKE
jgi:hypothetical protein